MQKLVLSAALVALACAGAEREPLFDGKDLSGWELINKDGKPSFAVENGVMRTTGHEGDAVFTRHKIGQATIHVVYTMSSEKGNSGVFIRIPVIPKTEETAINQGIEVQIDNRDNDYHCTGVLYSMTKALARPYKAPGEWNTMDITIDGPRTIVRVNGVLVTDYDGVSAVPPKVHPWEPDRHPRPDEGYIAVQAHDPSAVISFKEISVEPLTERAGEATDGWQLLKSLAGEWHDPSTPGEKMTMSYQVISNGSAVLETFKAAGGSPFMITVYHQDGKALMATHYCAEGNQPRMRAEPADAKRIAFRFLDVTNLAGPDAAHIRGVTITFVDKDHVTEEWTSRKAGKDATDTFRLTRVQR